MSEKIETSEETSVEIKLEESTFVQPDDYSADFEELHQDSRPPHGNSVRDIEESVERFLETDEYCDVTHEGDGMCLLSKYGPSHLSAQEAAKLVPRSDKNDSGLVWHAQIIGEAQEEILKKSRDWDSVNNCIKPRRGSLMVTSKDFFSSLIKTEENPPRWIFSGKLNGWPSLVLFEVQRITASITKPRSLIFRTWSSKKEGKKGIPPSFPKEKAGMYKHKEVRARLCAPGWTSRGWSESSPGYAWWYEGQRSTPRVLHGENLIKIPRQLLEDDPICTKIHMFSHRYAIGKNKLENPKERFTYHSAILLEWDHQKFCSVVELALLNGLSGYSGKSNWYHDKNEKPSLLYKTLPRRMVAPWKWSKAEIRVQDVEAKNLEEFKEFIWQYTGHEHRFVDPRFTHSHDVRLTFRSKSHICRYILNYIGRDTRYSEVFRNCQTFAADFYGFLAGKKGIEPFTYWNRIEYLDRSHLFLYDSDKYSTYV